MRVAVVGRGLIGSAAAKYLARAGHDVTLIGPGEPEDWASHEGVFASHYDEGRITRALDPDRFWSRISRASIARYAEIEAASGQRVFTEAGSVIAGAADGAMMAKVRAVAEAEGIAAEWLDAKAFAARFPYLRLLQGDLAAYEASGAGHISPRGLVHAQGICALQAGARIVDAEVLDVKPGRTVQLRTATEIYGVDHALIATGAFCRELLGSRVADVTPYARTAALFEIGVAEQARLAGMPTLIHQTAEDDPYILPPIRYPNGKSYLKLGGDPVEVPATDPAALRAWFRSGGASEVGAYLKDVLLRRIPDLAFEAMHIVPCSTTFTPEDKPRIGPVTDGISMAVAGCGRGAKCSDELGRMAAVAVESGIAADMAA